MTASGWSTQQLAEFLAAVSSAENEAAAGLAAVERAAEALDAEVAAIVSGGKAIAAIGYPEGAVPVAALEALPLGASSELSIPGTGFAPATAVPLEYPVGAWLVLARSGPDDLSREEAGLLRGMARVTSMTLRMLRLLDDERAARERSDRQAAENARLLAELAASRARIVAAADETRRQIERDLHDGAQQRLVALALQLQAIREALPHERDGLPAELERVENGLRDVLEEVREIARGIHPAVLSKGGLPPALKAVARRSALPVELDLRIAERLPQAVEVTAYYAISEALANATKHANASVVHVAVEVDADALRLSIRDDGVGGADPARGSGLVGLKDRIETTGGTLTVESRPGVGTSLLAELPIRGDDGEGRATEPQLVRVKS